METLLALTIGVLVATSVYLMLARNILRFIFGLVLLSNAVNLLIFPCRSLDPRRAAPDPPWRRGPSGAGGQCCPPGLSIDSHCHWLWFVCLCPCSHVSGLYDFGAPFILII